MDTDIDFLQREIQLDAEECIRIASSNPTAYNVRSAFRTVFAAAEASVAWFKHFALSLHANCPTLFSPAELALLREETYSLSSSGEAKVGERRIALSENLKFALRMFLKDVPSPYMVDYSADGWRTFQECLARRHRITHPKCHADLMVDLSDLAKLYKAEAWFQREIGNVMACFCRHRRSTHAIELLRQLSPSAVDWLRSVPAHLTAMAIARDAAQFPQPLPDAVGVNDELQRFHLVVDRTDHVLLTSFAMSCIEQLRSSVSDQSA